MLAGEHVLSVSNPGTLFLVPVATGNAKPLPQSCSVRNPPPSDVSGVHSHTIPHHVDVHSLASPHPMVTGGSSVVPAAQGLSSSNTAAAHVHFSSSASSAAAASSSPDVDAFFSNESTRRRSVIPVQCVCSNYRLVLTPLVSGGTSEMKRVQLPFMLMDRFELDLRPRDFVWALTISTKWTWVYRLQSSEETPLQQLAQMLQTRFPTIQSQFFAFEHFEALQQRCARLDGVPATAGDADAATSAEGGSTRCESANRSSQPTAATDVPLSILETHGTHDSAWGLFNLRRELHRQTVVDGSVFVPASDSPFADEKTPATHPESFGCGKNLAPWFRVVTLTSQRDAFRTYPLEVVVPRRVSHDLLERCASYRQNGRIPVISWVHGINGATLSRCSQPKAGAPGAKEDQTLCSYLNQSYHVTNAVCAPPASNASVSPAVALSAGAAAAAPSTAVAQANSSPSSSLVPPPSIIGDGSAVSPGGAVQLPSRAPPPPSLFEETHIGNAGTAKCPSGSDSDIEVDGRRSPSAAGRAAEPLRPLANKSEERPLHIMDFRTKTAAAANMATGGGFEIVWNYVRASIEFMNLDNIHAVRDSFDKLRKLCVDMQLPKTDCPVAQTAHGSFYARLHDTGWVLMLQRLIWASWKAATLVHQGVSVLGHCTDGWDRTAQVIALAKLQLDAHYRTLEGFCELVAWEWLEMGHKFGDRCATQRPLESSGTTDGGGGAFVFVGSDGEEDTSDDAAESATTAASASDGARRERPSASPLPPQNRGHPSTSRNHSSSPSSQISPVFLQFLDAVHQLWYMFPQYFEFTPALLSFLAESAYSCRFGTFLQNFQRARLRGGNGIATHTASVWGEIERRVAEERANASQVHPDERLLNPFFRPLMSRCPRGTPPAQIANAFYQQRIIPSFQAFRFRFWASLYCRHHWEGTGSAMDHDTLSPLYDAVLVLAQRANVRQLSDIDGWNDCCAEEVEDEQPECGGACAKQGTASSLGRHSRVLFRHRLPVTTVAAEWQIVGPPAQATRDASGANPGASVAPVFLARSNARACELCRAEFTMFFRRHTCRMCCRAACATCSSHFVVLPSQSIALYEEKDAKHPVRVCFQCYEVLNKVSAPSRR